MCYAVNVWREESMKRGLVKGREEGREEKTQEVVKSALAMGMSQEAIQSLLKIDAKEYQRYCARHG